MTTNIEGAINELRTLFYSNWLSKTAVIAGYVPKVYFQDVEDSEIPDISKYYVRFSTKKAGSEQSTLSENVVTNGSRRFETYGIVFIQLFCPKLSNAGVNGLKLAMLAQEIFRNATANVTLKNASIKDLPPEDGAIRYNITAEYEFDEIS